MNMKVALTNWKNLFRQMVGLPKAYPVKVLRSPEAKVFELIGVKKAGDVGYDLPTIHSTTIPAPSESQRRSYIYHMDKHRRFRDIGNKELSDLHYNSALSQLPKAIIPTGIRLEMPDSIWCSIEARSSSSSKMLITPDAIIDAGYRGELFAVIYNFGYEDYKVSVGERLVQIIFHERILADITEVNKLGDSERGESGFGSTGI